MNILSVVAQLVRHDLYRCPTAVPSFDDDNCFYENPLAFLLSSAPRVPELPADQQSRIWPLLARFGGGQGSAGSRAVGLPNPRPYPLYLMRLYTQSPGAPKWSTTESIRNRTVSTHQLRLAVGKIVLTFEVLQAMHDSQDESALQRLVMLVRSCYFPPVKNDALPTYVPTQAFVSSIWQGLDLIAQGLLALEGKRLSDIPEKHFPLLDAAKEGKGNTESDSAVGPASGVFRPVSTFGGEVSWAQQWMKFCEMLKAAREAGIGRKGLYLRFAGAEAGSLHEGTLQGWLNSLLSLEAARKNEVSIDDWVRGKPLTKDDVRNDGIPGARVLNRPGRNRFSASTNLRDYSFKLYGTRKASQLPGSADPNPAGRGSNDDLLNAFDGKAITPMFYLVRASAVLDYLNSSLDSLVLTKLHRERCRENRLWAFSEEVVKVLRNNELLQKFSLEKLLVGDISAVEDTKA